MNISKESSPTLPTKEHAIMAIGGAFNLSEMYSLAGLLGEVLITNQSLRAAVLFAAEFFYSDNLYDLATDLCAEGIISDRGVVDRLVSGTYFEANRKDRKTVDTQYPIVGIVGRG